jgi:hypothetical protein
VEEREQLEQELAAATVKLDVLKGEGRELRVRWAACTWLDALRPEAIPIVVELLDWDFIEDEDDDEAIDLNLDVALSDLTREHDYLFIPELLDSRPGGDADGGAHSYGDVRGAEPITRRSASNRLRLGYGGGVHWPGDGSGSSALRALRDE